MTDWQSLPKGTPVRVRIPGINGTAGYLVTRTKRAAYYVAGKLRIPVEGMDVAVPVREVELVPQSVEAGV